MRNKILLFLFFFSFYFKISAQDKERCGTPVPKGGNEAIARFLEESGRVENDEMVVIPLLFHVLHVGETVGEGSNVDIRQVQAQVDVLNEDFNRFNADRAKTLSQFQSVAASANIRFELARLDPEGKPLAEAGIQRQKVSKYTWTDNEIIAMMPTLLWNPNQYLNIIVVGDVANYYAVATFPNSSGLQGLNANETEANKDAIMMDCKILGSYQKFPAKIMETAADEFRYGRTLTHEMGHIFGLLHTWGGGSRFVNRNCQNLDHCADTPELQTESSGCNLNRISCNNLVMAQNYLDYADDNCMNLFTKDQVARMRQVLRNSPRRKELINSPVLGNSQAYLAKLIKFYPNPAQDYLKIESQQAQLEAYQIRDLAGRRIKMGILEQNQETIKLNDLAKGMYLLEIQSSMGKITKKIVRE